MKTMIPHGLPPVEEKEVPATVNLMNFKGKQGNICWEQAEHYAELFKLKAYKGYGKEYDCIKTTYRSLCKAGADFSTRQKILIQLAKKLFDYARLENHALFFIQESTCGRPAKVMLREKGETNYICEIPHKEFKDFRWQGEGYYGVTRIVTVNFIDLAKKMAEIDPKGTVDGLPSTPHVLVTIWCE